MEYEPVVAARQKIVLIDMAPDALMQTERHVVEMVLAHPYRRRARGSPPPRLLWRHVNGQ
jgi:hypothetical protein